MVDNGFPYGIGVELEVYPSADVRNPDYNREIWIAVNEKKQYSNKALDFLLSSL